MALPNRLPHARYDRIEVDKWLNQRLAKPAAGQVVRPGGSAFGPLVERAMGPRGGYDLARARLVHRAQKAKCEWEFISHCAERFAAYYKIAHAAFTTKRCRSTSSAHHELDKRVHLHVLTSRLRVIENVSASREGAKPRSWEDALGQCVQHAKEC